MDYEHSGRMRCRDGESIDRMSNMNSHLGGRKVDSDRDNDVLWKSRVSDRLGEDSAFSSSLTGQAP